MAVDRYVVLGVAPARSTWFHDLAGWSTAAALPVEFIQCLSLDEVRARLATGRRFSAVMVDARIAGIDRDLLALAAERQVTALVVGDPRIHRDWDALGATAVLPATLDRPTLLDALQRHCQPIVRVDRPDVARPATPAAPGDRGVLVAVLGPGGAGTSTVAMALAQGLHDRRGQAVLLADCALDADLAVLHDAGDVVPGLQELTEAHRFGRLAVDQVRELVFDVPDRGYQLLLGLRRHRDWVTVQPRAFAVALDNLRATYELVVTDVTADIEGHAECGSFDVEERNTIARTCVVAADVVVVVTGASPKSIHRAVRLIAALIDLGVAPGRIVPACNRAPRSPRARADIVAAISALTLASTGAAELAPMAFVPRRRQLEAVGADGARLPSALAHAIVSTVGAVLDRPEPVGATSPTAARQPGGEPQPVPVAPGSLGHWTDQDALP